MVERISEWIEGVCTVCVWGHQALSDGYLVGEFHASGMLMHGLNL